MMDSQGSDRSDPHLEQASHSSTSGSGPTSQAYEKLCNATEKAVRRVTSKTKVLPYIKEHFRPHYKADGKYVLEIYTTMMNQLNAMLKDELQLQLEANDVEQLLAQLDKTVQESPVTDIRWRPSSNPKEDIKAHLQKSAGEEVQQLEKILSSLEYQNQLLNEQVARTDQRLRQSVSTLHDHQQSWEKAATMMTEEARQALIDSDSILTKVPHRQLSLEKS